MITIGKAQIKEEGNKVVLTCKILIDEKEKELFYEIDKKYKDYLCTERSDAFIIAAFYYAMKYHHDIKCDVPMTLELYHNLTTYLIPTLSKHSSNLSNIKIDVPRTNEILETNNEVGTGISCGIDSFHVLKNYLNPNDKDMKLTCLCLNNVGSFNTYAEKYHGIGSENVRDEVIKKAEKVAKEVNLPLIITNSNVSLIFNNVYYRVHTFANMFSVLLMQKFFGKYYYASSGYDLSHYNIIDNYKLDSAEYDILTFYCLSTKNLKIYPEGNEKTRLEKTISIADFKLARENLHVCIKDSHNCGKCMKCKRTLLALDAIDKLDNFNKVFDIDYYKKHKDEYYDWLSKEDNEMNIVTRKLLNQKKTLVYKNIDVFNKNNIIIPELNIESISIKKDKYILNKYSDKNYNFNLAYKLLVCLHLTSLDNKQIKIPKHLLDNNKINYRKPKTLINKLKHIRRVLLNKKTDIYLHDLIYFILYKPNSSNRIIRYLNKNKYLKNINKVNTNTNELINIFEKVVKNNILCQILNTKEIKINGKLIKNTNVLINCIDSYYMNNQFSKSFMIVYRKKYYFIGKSNEYYIAIISKKGEKKIDILEEITNVYGLIKKLNDK